jgi:hypothetical protein
MKATGPPNFYAGHISIKIGIHKGFAIASGSLSPAFSI